ncbi:hypothetical protein B0H14DRAFT_1244680 [Mycena olivaceomarginata]|nr:hypothetical protein B0H14DRAFT_1244680 [Mycena olivaceomarginata]
MDMIQAIFRWLVFSARQVTSDELADAIAFRLSDPEFDFSDPSKSIYYPDRRRGNFDSFKLLEGLIVIKKDRSAKTSIALAHSSVKDYILSPQFREGFGGIITKEVSHKFIAQTCIRYLLLFADPNHLMTKDTVPDYPISLYAAEYWLYHLQCCDNRDQKALLPSTMRLLEDGSSQYAALCQLWTRRWGYIDFKLTRPVIEYVVGCVSETVDYAQERPFARSTYHTKFTTFVSTVLSRAEVPSATMLVALVYIARARPHLSIALEEYALERVFLGALIVASKYTENSPLKNVHWALCTGIFWKRDVGRIEREFLGVLDWELGVGEAELHAHQEAMWWWLMPCAVASGKTSVLAIRSNSLQKVGNPAELPFLVPLPF